jgi:hypothetical protein
MNRVNKIALSFCRRGWRLVFASPAALGGDKRAGRDFLEALPGYLLADASRRAAHSHGNGGFLRR